MSQLRKIGTPPALRFDIGRPLHSPMRGKRGGRNGPAAQGNSKGLDDGQQEPVRIGCGALSIFLSAIAEIPAACASSFCAHPSIVRAVQICCRVNKVVLLGLPPDPHQNISMELMAPSLPSALVHPQSATGAGTIGRRGNADLLLAN